MSASIRPAVPADAPAILAFIRELAEYERLLHEVKITLADVEALVFGPAPKVFCDIAEIGAVPVGFALWFYSVSTFEGRLGIYLEDLYVRPEARGAGAGKALLAHLARRCAAEGLAPLQMAVHDWYAPPIGFYDSHRPTAKTDLFTRRLSGDALARLAALTG